tara:strand:+ start:1392 stop:2114 length:723 start_codon:yes stop_codon:yes gene_type:complete
MNCIFENGQLFSAIVNAVKDLSGEANLDFTEGGILMQAMDSAHVSLCSLTLQKDLFKSYHCPDNISLGVNLKTLSMVLRGVKGELKLSALGDKLHIEVQKLDGNAKYDITLMDIDSESLGLPDSVYPAVCVLDSSTFAKVMRDLSDFSDTCTLKINHRLNVSVQGDAGHVNWQSGEECKCSASEVSSLDFSMRYMCMFTKAAAVSPKVVLSMAPNLPICVTFPIESGHLKFYLAPKMFDD